MRGRRPPTASARPADEPAARRSTSRRCRTPGSRPTSCRWRSRCSRSPTAPRSSPRTSSTTGSPFVDELIRMGADVRTEGRHAVVRGVDPALGCAGAGARRAGRRRARPRRAGRRRRDDVLDRDHVDRGYPDFPAPCAPSAPTSTSASEDHRKREFGKTRLRYLGVAPGRIADGSQHAARTASMEADVLEAIDAIRPALQADGGDIVFKAIDADGVVHVELVGACGTCPVSTMTLKAGVERIIMDRVPGRHRSRRRQRRHRRRAHDRR